MTLSSMFVGNVVLFIVMMGHGELMMAALLLLSSAMTGSAVTKIVMAPVKVESDPS